MVRESLSVARDFPVCKCLELCVSKIPLVRHNTGTAACWGCRWDGNCFQSGNSIAEDACILLHLFFFWVPLFFFRFTPFWLVICLGLNFSFIGLEPMDLPHWLSAGRVYIYIYIICL